MDNFSEQLLQLVVYIGIQHHSIRSLAKLCLVSKAIHSEAIKQLNSIAKLRDKLRPKLADYIVRSIIAHPFKYHTEITTVLTPMRNPNMLFSQAHGFVPYCHDYNVFTPEFIIKNKLAIAGISVVTNREYKHAALYINGFPLLRKSISMNEIQIGGETKYVCDVFPILKYNPIIPVGSADDEFTYTITHFNLYPEKVNSKYMLLGNEIVPTVEKIIVRFACVDRSKYQWDEYGLLSETLNDMNRVSLVKKISYINAMYPDVPEAIPGGDAPEEPQDGVGFDPDEVF